MNELTQARSRVVIEFAGYPGAGKTTICQAIKIAHKSQDSVPLKSMLLGPPIPEAAWHLFLLCFTARPFKAKRLARSIGLLTFLRCYASPEEPVVLDRGIVQKLWSILMDAEEFSRSRLRRFIATIRPVAASHIVWVETPLETAAVRVSRRTSGNSRFDALSVGQITVSLSAKSALLQELTELYQQQTGALLERIDGLAPVEVNGELIGQLVRGSNRRNLKF